MAAEAPIAEAPADLDRLKTELRAGVKIEDRTWLLRSYPRSFVGAEAVTWLVEHKYAASREEAVSLGGLLQDANIFSHVTGDHAFKDESLFYRFAEDDPAEHGKVPVDHQGRSASWAQFLGLASPQEGASGGSGGDTDMNARRSTPEFLASLEKPLADAAAAAAVADLSRLNVAPMDAHNSALLDAVHPAAWVEPAPKGIYNVVVIGAGSGGLVTAAGAAGVGAKVALIEENLLGGDCLNVGCVPSKLLLSSARMAANVKHRAAKFGIIVKGEVEIDFAAVMERLRRVRAQIAPHDSAERFASLGIDVFLGHGVFTGKHSVSVNGKTLKFARAVVATGGSAAVPPIAGIHSVRFLTNADVFNLTERPPRLAVIGTGPIGCELGQAFSLLESNVTIFNRSDKVLGREDPEAAQVVRGQMEKDGVAFALGVEFVKIEYVEPLPEAEAALVSTRSVDAFREIRVTYVQGGELKHAVFDALLVSTGRRPNVDNVGLGAAGIEFDSSAGVHVNDFLQTTNKDVYAVGDVCTPYKFTHASDFMARTVIRNALFFGRGKMSKLLIPWATYTHPEIAHVGLYEPDLQERKIEYTAFTKYLKDVDRALLDGDDDLGGFVKVLVQKGTDKIVGATIVAANAGDMISEFTLCMQHKIGLGSLALTIHPYPTQAEAVRQSGDLFNRTRLSPMVKAIFRRLMEVRR